MKNYKFGLLALLLITLTLALAASNFTTPEALQSSPTAEQQIQQPTPITQSNSEIGSTDGILILGIVITLIVTVPILVRKK